MTILAERPVTSPAMTEPQPLDRVQVGELIGVAPNTVSIYMQESREGGRYEREPFPAPDGYVRRSPYWSASRADEIKAWATARPRHGIGGRPRSGA